MGPIDAVSTNFPVLSLKTQFEYRLFDLSSSQAQNVPLSGSMIMRYAWGVKEKLKVDNFKASRGWSKRFQARHRISIKTRSGEGADTNKAVVHEWKERVV